MKYIVPALMLSVATFSLVIASEPASQPTGVATSAPAPSQPASTPTSKIVVEQSTVKGLIETLNAAGAARDVDTIAACIEPSVRETAKKILLLNLRIPAMQKPVFKAIDESFTPASAQEVKLSDIFRGGEEKSLSPVVEAVKNGRIDWEKIKIAESEASASVAVNGGAPWYVKKIDGKWYSIPGGNHTEAELLDAIKAMEKGMDILSKVYVQLEKGIRDGSITPANFEIRVDEIWKKAAPGI